MKRKDARVTFLEPDQQPAERCSTVDESMPWWGCCDFWPLRSAVHNTTMSDLLSSLLMIYFYVSLKPRSPGTWCTATRNGVTQWPFVLSRYWFLVLAAADGLLDRHEIGGEKERQSRKINAPNLRPFHPSKVLSVLMSLALFS